MPYTREEIHDFVNSQREFFLSGKTLDVKFRKEQLKKLRQALIDNQKLLEDVLHEDLGRSDAEAFFCDIGDTVMEINEYLKGIKKWNKPERHFSGLAAFPSFTTKVYKLPYGVSLIISPFNFPVLLSIGVLAAAIAGGNTAIIKTSSKSPACTAVLKKILEDTYPSKYVAWPKYDHYIAPHKYANLSRRMSFPAFTDEEGVNSLINEVRNLNHDLGIPNSFKDAFKESKINVTEEEYMNNVDKLADLAFGDQCTTSNPRLPLVSELRQILIESYYGTDIF